MKCRALHTFNAHGLTVSANEIIEIENRDLILDLERVGFLERLEYEVSEDMKRVRKTLKNEVK